MGSLSEATLASWRAAGLDRQFRPRQALVNEAEPGVGVHLLLAGCVKVVARWGQDTERLLAIRSAGDLVGEFAALDDDVHSASVVACGRDKVLTCEIPVAMFRELLAADRVAAAVVTAAVTGKMRAATRRRVDLGLPPVTRLAHVVLDLLEQFGRELRPGISMIGVSLTYAELGALATVGRPAVYRIFRSWREQHVLETGRRLVVTDEKRLRALAAAPVY